MLSSDKTNEEIIDMASMLVVSGSIIFRYIDRGPVTICTSLEKPGWALGRFDE